MSPLLLKGAEVGVMSWVLVIGCADAEMVDRTEVAILGPVLEMGTVVVTVGTFVAKSVPGCTDGTCDVSVAFVENVRDAAVDVVLKGSGYVDGPDDATLSGALPIAPALEPVLLVVGTAAPVDGEALDETTVKDSVELATTVLHDCGMVESELGRMASAVLSAPSVTTLGRADGSVDGAGIAVCSVWRPTISVSEVTEGVVHPTLERPEATLVITGWTAREVVDVEGPDDVIVVRLVDTLDL
jgi:hypothetical protein